VKRKKGKSGKSHLGSNQIKLGRTASALVNFLFLYLLYFYVLFLTVIRCVFPSHVVIIHRSSSSQRETRKTCLCSPLLLPSYASSV
jgi:hypothetical protein